MLVRSSTRVSPLRAPPGDDRIVILVASGCSQRRLFAIVHHAVHKATVRSFKESRPLREPGTIPLREDMLRRLTWP